MLAIWKRRRSACAIYFAFNSVLVLRIAFRTQPPAASRQPLCPPPPTAALFSSLVGRHHRHSPNPLNCLPKTFQSEWSTELARCLCTGLPVRENPRGFHLVNLVLPIPVLVHLTGSVLDGDAPFGSNVLRAIHVVKGWHGSCSGGLLTRLCACRPYDVSL
jgi:hypothetical protein